MQLLVSFEYYIKKIYLFVIGSRFVAQAQELGYELNEPNTINL